MELSQYFTAGTNFLIFLLAVWWGLNIFGVGNSGKLRKWSDLFSSVRMKFGLFMVLLGVSFGLAGIDHMFFEVSGPDYLSKLFYLSSWILTVVCSLLMVEVAFDDFDQKHLKIARGVAIFMAIAAAVMVVIKQEFLYVILAYLPAILVFLALAVRNLREKINFEVVLGIILVLLGSYVQTTDIQLGVVDHNGFYHLIVLIALWFFYDWGKKL